MTTDATAGRPPGVPLIQMKGISKAFGSVKANDSVDFDIYGGEVHALLGENGAGKTTLMNILYGLYRADSGEILVNGKRVAIRSPKDAIALKVAMVHQQFELVPTLTVAENVGLGLKSEREPLLNLDAVAKRINELTKEYGLAVNSATILGQLSVGERQRVEIIKALYRNPETLILDEPTSVLTPQETEGLFHFIRSMAAEGRAVVVITHKLPEVMAVSDRVTVLRHGRVVARLATKDTNPDDLAEKMVGREIGHREEVSIEVASEKLALDIQEVSAMNDAGALALTRVSLSVKAGEILGLAGVAGNGQTELAEVLTGMRKVVHGRVSIEGSDVTNASPATIIDRGVGNIPEDRLGTGLVLDMSIAENLVLETRTNSRFDKRHLLDYDEVRANARKLVEEYSIMCGSVDAPARTLSGGNMQKLILAKVLSRNPKVLIASQPTSGLDVGATEFISEKLREQKRLGVAILLISSDLNEIMSLSDRVACVFEGKVMGIVPAATAELKDIGLMMGGVGRG